MKKKTTVYCRVKLLNMIQEIGYDRHWEIDARKWLDDMSQHELVYMPKDVCCHDSGNSCITFHTETGKCGTSATMQLQHV